jgi:hypothetical protein
MYPHLLAKRGITGLIIRLQSREIMIRDQFQAHLPNRSQQSETGRKAPCNRNIQKLNPASTVPSSARTGKQTGADIVECHGTLLSLHCLRWTLSLKFALDDGFMVL